MLQQKMKEENIPRPKSTFQSLHLCLSWWAWCCDYYHFVSEACNRQANQCLGLLPGFKAVGTLLLPLPHIFSPENRGGRHSNRGVGAVGCPLALLQSQAGTTSLPPCLCFFHTLKHRRFPLGMRKDFFFCCEDAEPSACSCPLADQ